MPVKVEIRAKRQANRRVQRRLEKLEQKIKDPSAANRQVSIWLLRWVNENFRTQGRRVGGWQPFKLGGRKLRDGTIDTGAKLLQDTGRLRSSITPFWSKSNAGVGSRLPYAEVHELGLGHVPRRRILPDSTDKDVTDAVIKIYDTYIRRAARA